MAAASGVPHLTVAVGCLLQPDAGHSKKPEKSGMELSDMVSGTRKRKQRTVMVDGKGTGYGGAVPVLAQDLADQEVGEAGRPDQRRPER